jgi:hypothetical protein
VTTVYIASDDQEPWCTLCQEVVPGVIEVDEKVFACSECLRDLSENLRRATGQTEWSTEWPTEAGHYWAWVRWPRDERLENVVIEVRQIGSGPVYFTSGAFVSKGTDFSPPTFSEALFCRIPDPPPAPVPSNARPNP